MKNQPNWTEINDIDTYKRLVERAAEVADQKPLAEWELDAFSRK